MPVPRLLSLERAPILYYGMARIMVFAPHPDDDIIGCGGSIAKYVRAGDAVTIIYMTSGDAGSLAHSRVELARLRESEAAAAAELLGVSDLVFLRGPDGYLDCTQGLLVRVIDLIRARRPELVYLPHQHEAHRDHRKTHELVIEAVARAGGPCFQECPGAPWYVKTLLCYEVGTPLQEPSYHEDITEFIDLKLRALAEHRTQVQVIPYTDAVKGLNRYRGIMASGKGYGESFQVLLLPKLL